MSLSTHVLDASAGRPAAGVAVRLDQRDGTEWRAVGDGRTDADGRLKGWRPHAAGPGRDAAPEAPMLAAGDYRLVFGTGDYFAQRGIEAFHPEVAVAFRITDPAEHHHVPLLLSPYSYTTYRGS